MILTGDLVRAADMGLLVFRNQKDSTFELVSYYPSNDFLRYFSTADIFLDEVCLSTSKNNAIITRNYVTSQQKTQYTIIPFSIRHTLLQKHYKQGLEQESNRLHLLTACLNS